MPYSSAYQLKCLIFHESMDKLDDSYSGRRKLFLIMGYQHLFYIDIASFKTALTIG